MDCYQNPQHLRICLPAVAASPLFPGHDHQRAIPPVRGDGGGLELPWAPLTRCFPHASPLPPPPPPPFGPHVPGGVLVGLWPATERGAGPGQDEGARARPCKTCGGPTIILHGTIALSWAHICQGTDASRAPTGRLHIPKPPPPLPHAWRLACTAAPKKDCIQQGALGRWVQNYVQSCDLSLLRTGKVCPRVGPTPSPPPPPHVKSLGHDSYSRKRGPMTRAARKSTRRSTHAIPGLHIRRCAAVTGGGGDDSSFLFGPVTWCVEGGGGAELQ